MQNLLLALLLSGNPLPPTAHSNPIHFAADPRAYLLAELAFNRPGAIPILRASVRAESLWDVPESPADGPATRAALRLLAAILKLADARLTMTGLHPDLAARQEAVDSLRSQLRGLRREGERVDRARIAEGRRLIASRIAEQARLARDEMTAEHPLRTAALRRNEELLPLLRN